MRRQVWTVDQRGRFPPACAFRPFADNADLVIFPHTTLVRIFVFD
jgi:hypothetical protein